MKPNVLFAWLGKNDMDACFRDHAHNLGPIGEALTHRNFTHVVLLSVFPEAEEKKYIAWLGSVARVKVMRYHTAISTDNQFRETYESSVAAIRDTTRKLGKENLRRTYHLSSGSLAMVASWILLSKTYHPAELIQTSRKAGVQTVSLPYDLSASKADDDYRHSDDEIREMTRGLPPESPAFASIIHKCKPMERVIAQARRLAVHDVPVLIQGESGTGKELFARAIHASSPRHEKPFVSVNCGSIPPDLVEAEFFGHVKGAFTGAITARDGHFIEADGGTLFLDEIGELPLLSQVKLLRVIQEGSVTKLGSSRVQTIDVRIIAAANTNLLEQVSNGRFRDDLFHRLAVGFLQLPPLRERHGDIDPIMDNILDKINRQFKGKPWWDEKRFARGARTLIHHHPWPGNVRELFNTISRASIWTPGRVLNADDIRAALFPVVKTTGMKADILERPFDEGFSLPAVLAEVAQHYLKRAVTATGGSKTGMARVLGLPNYQTLSNWLKKYRVG